MANQESKAPVLVKKVVLQGRIVAMTGLHIGGNDTGLGVGGADRLVVREPRTGAPYIPGSSFKGKMRSLLEKTVCAARPECNFRVDGGLSLPPCSCGKCDVCLVFGVAADEKRPYEPGKPYGGAGRALFRDAPLLNGEEIANWPNLDTPFAEIKTEVSIDRLTSRANPRQFERVPAGAAFGLEISLNVYDTDVEENLLATLRKGFELLGNDALGGQGSRGYGQVRIELTKQVELRLDRYGAEGWRQETQLREVYGGRIAER